MKISSPAFENGQSIPQKYTCDGEGISPPLEFTEVPDGAESLVLIVDDPDAPAGLFTHWIVFNIPANAPGIEEGGLPVDSIEGGNSSAAIGYTPPCPPDGSHRYMFKLYALDSVLVIDEGVSQKALEDEMTGQIIDEALLVGNYQRAT